MAPATTLLLKGISSPDSSRALTIHKVNLHHRMTSLYNCESSWHTWLSLPLLCEDDNKDVKEQVKLNEFLRDKESSVGREAKAFLVEKAVIAKK